MQSILQRSLLLNFWAALPDVDGDQLRFKNVRTLNGNLTSENKDGSWLIKTKGESGIYELVFDVTDGELTTKAEASVTINHKPLFTSFEFLTTTIKVEEGQSISLGIRRTGNTQTQQSVSLKLDGADISTDDLALPEVIFEEGSDHASIELKFNKDGLWEGIEKGNIIVDKVIGQGNIISNWRIEKPVSLMIWIHGIMEVVTIKGNGFGVAGAISNARRCTMYMGQIPEV